MTTNAQNKAGVCDPVTLAKPQGRPVKRKPKVEWVIQMGPFTDGQITTPEQFENVSGPYEFVIDPKTGALTPLSPQGAEAPANTVRKYLTVEAQDNDTPNELPNLAHAYTPLFPQGIPAPLLFTPSEGVSEKTIYVRDEYQTGVIEETRCGDKPEDEGQLQTEPTPAPTETPTDAPTEPPTDAPTEPPTDAPTEPPTDAPTEPPTDAPTEPPTDAPTDAPTEPPTDAPTEPPTDAPTEPPTDAPTEPPTDAPTEPPTECPTEAPTQPPTDAPDCGSVPKSCGDYGFDDLIDFDSLFSTTGDPKAWIKDFDVQPMKTQLFESKSADDGTVDMGIKADLESSMPEEDLIFGRECEATSEADIGSFGEDSGSLDLTALLQTAQPDIETV